MQAPIKKIAMAGAVVLVIAAFGFLVRQERQNTRVAQAPGVTNDPFADLVIPEKYRSDEGTRQLFEQRIDAVKKMYQEKPNIWETWIAIGSIRMMIEDYPGAIDAYKKSLAITPNNILGNRNIAEVYNQYLHDYPAAAAYYRLAIQSNVSGPEMYISLAQVQYYKLHDAASSERTLLDGLSHTQNNPEVMVHLINLYRETKNMSKYREYARILVQTYPNNATYRRAYADALK